MAIRTLEQSQAFSPGASLWVIPQNCNTSIIKKIDWYMNFQVTRALQHKSEVLAPQLIRIVNENALPNFAPEKITPHTLMVARQNLPAEWLVAAQNNDNIATWAQNIHEIWKKLGQPQTRVFLPEDMKSQNFEKAWPDKALNHVEVVPAQ